MGGRLLDYIAQGIAADRPLAADMPARIAVGGASVYFSNDTVVLSFFNANTVAWNELEIAANFAGLDDVDFSTPPTDGQIFEWDTTLAKLIPVDKPTSMTTEEVQDIVGALIINGAGITVQYNDAAGSIEIISNVTQYTDENAMDIVAAMFALGTHVGVTPVYDDLTNSFSVSISVATAVEMWTGTSNSKVVTPGRIYSMAEPVAVAYAAAIALDGNAGINFSTTLTGNVTFSNPTNMKPGQSGLYVVTQDATGTRIATWGANWRFEGGAAVNGLLSTAANAVDAISYYVRPDGTIIGSILKDIKA